MDVNPRFWDSSVLLWGHYSNGEVGLVIEKSICMQDQCSRSIACDINHGTIVCLSEFKILKIPESSMHACIIFVQ